MPTAWKLPLLATVAALAAALLAGFVLVPAGRASTDWRRLGPITMGELAGEVTATLGASDLPGSACRRTRLSDAKALSLTCAIAGGTVWIDFFRLVGNCGPAEGCDRPNDCGLEGACRAIATSRIQTIEIGHLSPAARGETRLTFDGVGLGRLTPLPCDGSTVSRCASRWKGLHFKRKWIEGVGGFSSWQGEARRGGLRMWVTVLTVDRRIALIDVEQY